MSPRLFFAVCVLVIAGATFANGQEMTVKYLSFPTGSPEFSHSTIKGCLVKSPAPEHEFRIEGSTTETYDFAFWDVNGKLSFDRTQSFCSDPKKETSATAWYLLTGGGNCPTTGCFVTTFAFSLDHQVALQSGTAIEVVKPNTPTAWTSPSTTVLTNSAEAITAQGSLTFPSYGAESFLYWKQLMLRKTSPPTPPGSIFNATQNDTAYIVAFYGPDPCLKEREALNSCLEGPGEKGPLNCSPFKDALEACEKKHGESQ
jgi:hypothetical protein